MMDAQEPTALAVVPGVHIGSDLLDIIRQTVAPDLNNAELQFVAEWCNSIQLSPFLKQVHVWKQGGKLNFQISIDGARALAMRTGKHRGRIGPQWCGKDGQWRDVWLESTPPAAARVGIRWEGMEEPFWGVCVYERYANRIGASPVWKQLPDVMSAKVAEMQALRAACPVDLGGVYTAGEIPDDDRDEAPRASTPSRAQRAAPPARIVDEGPPASRPATAEQRRRLERGAELLGIEAPTDEEYAALTFEQVNDLLARYRDEYKRQKAEADTAIGEEASHA